MRVLLTSILLVSTASAQVTYTGCHNVSASTALVEWCYGPNGNESPLVTFIAPTSNTFATISTPATISATVTSSGQTTAVTGCHKHSAAVFCVNGQGNEVSVSLPATVTGEPPAQYTGCHSHGSEQYCLDPNGSEVKVTSTGERSTQEMDCHFHAGVEHCVPVGSSEGTSTSCQRRDREYNIPFRVGTLFAVLAASAVGAYFPLFVSTTRIFAMNGYLFTFLKQFGTGVIIATAFVHLYTHASLMFTNECLGRLSYEATTSAIVMAGIFVSFLIEYVSRRILASQSKDRTDLNNVTERSSSKQPQATVLHYGHHGHAGIGNTKLSVIVLEAGVIFHSLLLGLTLVVAGDSAYITLLVVIIFHQFFEGVALGSRIAGLSSSVAKTWPTKVLMALAFALVTPVGMAIGIGVLQHFNGNDPSTILAIGTLDAFSAGILAWVGLVEMWALDWIVPGGDLVDSSLVNVGIGGSGLVIGLMLMSVLGKWA